MVTDILWVIAFLTLIFGGSAAMAMICIFIARLMSWMTDKLEIDD